MSGGTSVRFFQSFGIPKDKDALRLIIMRSGCIARRLQDEIQLLLLYRLCTEFAQGVSCGGQGLEIYTKSSLIL